MRRVTPSHQIQWLIHSVLEISLLFGKECPHFEYSPCYFANKSTLVDFSEEHSVSLYCHPKVKGQAKVITQISLVLRLVGAQ